MVLIKNFAKEIYCINLKKRVDRKNKIQKMAKKHKLKIKFFKAIENKEGWIGCLQSHLAILKLAKKRKLKNVMIIEDDCKIVNEMKFDKKLLPKNWDMLYFGANIIDLIEEDHFAAKKKKFVRFNGLTTHCFMINSRIYDELIELITPCLKAVDRYYNEYHKKNKCYITNPLIAIQEEGFSDIEQKNLKYILPTIEEICDIPEVEHVVDKNTNQYKIKLDDFSDEELPNISILTITKNRKKFFPLPIHCFNSFIYPKEKVEWVIVDDSDDGTDLYDVLPKDSRIKYYKINTKKKLTVGMKRNISVKLASHNILLNMDDDDYYFPISLLSRAKVLLQYPKIGCVGAGYCNCYHVEENKHCFSGSKKRIAEASMGFRRKFWEQKKFKNNIQRGEGEGNDFQMTRKEECLRIPYGYIFSIINHKSNITGKLRENGENEVINELMKFPDKVLSIIKKVHS